MPLLFQMPNGDVLCQTSLTGDREFAKEYAGLLRSVDRGRSWKPEPHPLENAAWCIDFQPGGDTVILMDYRCVLVKGSSPRRWLFRFVESTDGGGSFGPVQFGEADYPLAAGTSLGVMHDRCAKDRIWDGRGLSRYRDVFQAAGWDPDHWREITVSGFTPSMYAKAQLADGSWLGLRDAAMGGRDDEALPWGTVGLVTRDGGRSWTYRSTCFQMTPARSELAGFMEPALIRLDNGLLYCILRTGGGPSCPMVHSWSSDEGESWQPPTSFHYVGIAPCLVKLKNGVLAATWGRPGRWVMFDPTGTGLGWLRDRRVSLTAGEQLTLQTNARAKYERLDIPRWSQPFVSWDMPSMIEVEPNVLLAAYDQQNFIETPGAPPKRAIRLVRIGCER